MIKIKQATKKGYIECCNGGVADLSYPTSKLRRGRVQGGGGISPTVTANNGLYRVYEYSIIQKCGDRDKIDGYTIHDYSNTIPSNPMSDRGQMLMEKEYKGRYRIRKLTEFECFKLMGFTSEDCQKCKDVGVSKSQLYRQAGNSIVTNCIQLIWEHIFKSQYDSSYITYDENFTKAVVE